MKLFQVKDNFCYCDLTAKHQTIENTIGKYPPDVLIVEAPNYVREGWGYDPYNEENHFLEPIPPTGWLYDKQTGTFYEEKCKILDGSHIPDFIELEQQRLTEIEQDLIVISQTVTDNDLSAIEQGQAQTDLEIMILGG